MHQLPDYQDTSPFHSRLILFFASMAVIGCLGVAILSVTATTGETVEPTLSLAEFAQQVNATVTARAQAAQPTPTPSPTSTPSATPTPTSTPSATPTATRTPIPPYTGLAIPTLVPPTPTPVAQIRVITGNANFRAGPGMDYEIVDALDYDTIAQVIARDPGGTWYNVITAAGTLGWLHYSVVQFLEPLPNYVIAGAATVPAPPPTSTPLPTWTPGPRLVQPSDPPPAQQIAPPAGGCCKICRTGKACGNTCINRSYTCHVGPGCACNG